MDDLPLPLRALGCGRALLQRRHGGLALTAAALFGLTACSSTGRDETHLTGPAPAELAPEASSDVEPLYALHTVVFDPDFNATSYVTLSHTLEVTGSLSGAREFPGWATMAAVGGHLLVADETEPRITRYGIGPDLAWNETGSLSFGNYGVADAGFGRQWLLNEHTAYAELDVTQRVVWDPTDLVIRGVKEDTVLEPLRGKLEIEPGLNRQPRLHRGPVLRPFYYVEKTDWLEYAPTSQIAVYDPETGAERSVVDAPCPGLHVGTQDEAGNTYFGLWDALPKLALFGQGPAPCVARLKLDGTLDEQWAPDLAAWTGGRPVMVFRYVKNGKALANVLHLEELNADFSGPYDPDVGDQLDVGEHYRVWMFDLETQTAQPVTGLPNTSWGFHASDLDGRSFVFLPYEDYGRTRVFEIDMATGSAIERFETTGWVYDWVRLR